MSWDEETLRAHVSHVEQLLERVAEQGDTLAADVVQALVDLYGEALGRAVALAADNGIADQLAEDELLQHLMLVHDLHPDDVTHRVSQAVEEVKPQLHAHGADAELLRIESGTVSVRLEAEGCGSTAATLSSALEDAIRCAAPEVERVDVAQPAAKPVLVTVDELMHASPSASA